MAIVIIVLFGSKRLPDAARAVGKSMRILKSETKAMGEEGEGATHPAPPARTPPTPFTPPAPPVRAQGSSPQASAAQAPGSGVDAAG
ncbi:Sec-independent protein translocase subunit TatA [Streptomyces sp. 35G-GA-8]|uniref:Sec-independent protein translocase subunit TatA n=1 Tax=Streptomyces sp. 35G-GA-8 TaxID=2939434 RepID=UPI0035B37C1F